MKFHWEDIYRYVHQDKTIPHILLACYHIFSHWISESVLSLVGTVGIAVSVSKPEYSSFLLPSILVYTIILVGRIISNQYDKYVTKRGIEEENKKRETYNSIKNENKLMNTVLSDIRSLDGTASAGVYRIARTIKHNGWTSSLKDIREAFGFQNMAMLVCKAIYGMLHEHYGWTNQMVSVYQRFERQKGKSYCRMIAYGNEKTHEPVSYHVEYDIPKKYTEPKSEDDRIHFHTVLFVKNSNSIQVLPDKDSIKRCFKVHPTCEEREKAIEQYIGIPMNVCNRGVTFVLQIDTDIKNGFGYNSEEVLLFAETYLSKYASVLAMYYEMDRMIEVACKHEEKNKININGRRDER